MLVSINVLEMLYTFCLLLIFRSDPHFIPYSSVLQCIYRSLKTIFGVVFVGVIRTWLSCMMKVTFNFCLAVGSRNMGVLGLLPKS